MTVTYEDVGTRGDVAIASVTVQAHRDGVCPECQEDGCDQLARAERTLAEHRRDRELARAGPASW